MRLLFGTAFLTTAMLLTAATPGSGQERRRTINPYVPVESSKYLDTSPQTNNWYYPATNAYPGDPVGRAFGYHGPDLRKDLRPRSPWEVFPVTGPAVRDYLPLDYAVPPYRYVNPYYYPWIYHASSYPHFPMSWQW